MKILLFIPALAAVLFVASCRTKLPTDPMTNHPSTRCLPENMGQDGQCHGYGSK
jgi:hypothetical protein